MVFIYIDQHSFFIVIIFVACIANNFRTGSFCIVVLLISFVVIVLLFVFFLLVVNLILNFCLLIRIVFFVGFLFHFFFFDFDFFNGLCLIFHLYCCFFFSFFVLY